MRGLIRNLIKFSLKSINIGITKYSTLQKFRENETAGSDIEFLYALNGKYASDLIYNLYKSKSQHKQDLFVLSQLNFKKHGYFVEFGATNGIDLSNSYLLEKEFGWTGILAEPANCWHKSLKKNRDAHIETDCIWSDSNSILNFKETDAAILSTIDFYSSADEHSDARKNGKIYAVKTISLNDLLIKYNAPKVIDYLSIDTEGSEFEILKNFDFSKHHFNIITCEHNFTPMREKIFELLSGNGYIRKFQKLSMIDDWYTKQ